MERHGERNPAWWSEEKHGSAWERVKTALRRDWEQTKSDLTRHRRGTDLNQGVGDTVRQATGRTDVPPSATPNPGEHDAWDRVEPAYRYGYGASRQYTEHDRWDPNLENRLRREWEDLRSGRTWDEIKDFVRRGWNAGRTPSHGT